MTGVLVIGTLKPATSWLLSSIPVDPDNPDARDLIVQELSKPEYQAAKPTWWDLMSKALWDWLTSLKFDVSGIPGGWFSLAIGTVLVVAIVVLIAQYGVPRLQAKSNDALTLFSESDLRTSDELLESAKQAALRKDWNLAIEDAFRSIARSLLERVLVNSTPGTTAVGFANNASLIFPSFASRLTDGAASFDRVRYLEEEGTEAEYLALLELGKQIKASQPLNRSQPQFQVSNGSTL